MASKNQREISDSEYLQYLAKKKNLTEEERVLSELLSDQEKGKLPDFKYLSYLEKLRLGGRWSRRERLLWGYLSVITMLLYRLVGGGIEEDRLGLKGQFRPYTPPEKRKPPPSHF